MRNKHNFRINKNGHHAFDVYRGYDGEPEFSKNDNQYVQMLLNSDNYKKFHSLERGVRYPLVVVFGDAIKRTTEEIGWHYSHYNYQIPLAGMVPPIREVKELPPLMKKMGVQWLVALHRPIKSVSNNSSFLSLFLKGGELRLCINFSSAGASWDCDKAFIFHDPSG